MTYFGFLALFLLPPLLVLGWLTYTDQRRGFQVSGGLDSWPLSRVIAIHILLALIYTTPWDNYLVATNVWWYNPDLVTGLTIGWVPVEEYTFFVLQTMLTGLWLGVIIRHIYIRQAPPPDLPLGIAQRLRWFAGLSLTPLWVAALVSLILAWEPLTYLSLILVWALPPIMLQLLFGADILWKYRKPVLLVIFSATLYLAVADSLAIQAGTWVISPQQTINFHIGGSLPFEEILFFLMTNVLIVFGSVLLLARESQRRIPRAILNRLNPKRNPNHQTNSSGYPYS